ncbi:MULTISPECIES: NADH-quinone oxidoreductase subunit 5 family protein [Bacteria]
MTGAEVALWLVPLLPAVVGVVLLLGGGGNRAAPVISVATAGLTVLLALTVGLTGPTVAAPFLPGMDFVLRVDPLSAFVVPMVAIVAALVLAFSVADVRHDTRRFHGLMLLFASAALLTAAAGTVPTLLLGWEVMGATSYALIGFGWREERRVSAGLTAFLTTRAADLGLYVAAGAAFAGGAGLDLGGLAEATPGWRDTIAAGIVLAALGKAAQLPFSFWLSGAMQGPSPVSALLHSAAMVALGSYLLLRVSPLLEATGWAGPLVAWVGAVTAVALGIVAIAQRDLKQLLAASTAAQLGFVVLAAGLSAVAAGTAHLVAHAATKAALFLAAGAWLTALGTKRLSALSGVARRWTITGAAFTVAALALAGVPPLSLWATKDAILAAALEESGWLYAVGLLASALSAAYAAKAIWVVWARPPADAEHERHWDEEERGTRAVTSAQYLPVVVLAVAAAVLGILALPPLAPVVAGFLGDATAVPPSLLELLVSAVLAIVVLLSVRRVRLPEPKWAQTWLGMERGVRAAVVRPTLALATTLARFDDRVLDRGVEAAAIGTARAARAMGRVDDAVLDRGVDAAGTGTLLAGVAAARVDDRGVDGAVEVVAAAVRRAGRAARRPQSGLLHQYYLQAVAVLTGVGVVLLLLSIG